MQSMYVMTMHAIFGDMLIIQLEVTLLPVQERCQVKLRLLWTKCILAGHTNHWSINTVIESHLRNSRM